MAVTLDAIHQPLNDFFLNEFKTEPETDVMFRFDTFGSVLSDADFVDSAHPDVDLPLLAVEKFSDLVNRVPIDAGDGLNVLLSADSIDSAYYFRLLSPSMPFIPAGAGDAAKEGAARAFFALKRAAMLTWENAKLESMGGLRLQYKPSTATPEDWFDRTQRKAWTNRTFQIGESPAPAPGVAAPVVVWRAQLSDEAIATIALPPIAADLPDRTAAALQFDDRRLVDAPIAAMAVSRMASAQPLSERVALVPPLARLALAPVTPLQLAVRHDPRTAAFTDEVAVDAVPAVFTPSDRAALDATFVQQYQLLDVKERLWVNQYVDDNAAAQPAKATGISIAFDHCLVTIRRPWLVDAFLNAPTWWTPATPKGQVTRAGQPGAVALLPIAFVAIRDLQIEANWSGDDVVAAARAVRFGPFKISPGIVAGKLSHPGLQIVGWLLQRLPPLPPQDAPV